MLFRTASNSSAQSQSPSVQDRCHYEPLQWSHIGRDGTSNHQPHNCLLKRLFRRRYIKHQNSASLAFVRGIHRWPVNSPHKWPVTRKMFPIDDVIMTWRRSSQCRALCYQWAQVDITPVKLFERISNVDQGSAMLSFEIPLIVTCTLDWKSGHNCLKHIYIYIYVCVCVCVCVCRIRYWWVTLGTIHWISHEVQYNLCCCPGSSHR